MRKILGTGCKVERLFELIYFHIPIKQISVAVKTSHSLYKWHFFLGHTSVSKLHLLVSCGLLRSTKFDSFHCLHCQLAKQPTLSLNTSSSISNSLFELVHSYIFGVLPLFLL
ncbi:hypothetical protein REPUB_Repub10bG0051300 [Reevesia pubescens]